MTLKKLLLAIAGGVAVLGAFLPWLRVSLFGFSVSSNAFGIGGALYIILAILAILCGVVAILLNVLKEKQIKNIIKFKALDKMPLVIGIVLVAIAVIAFIALMSQAQGLGTVSWGVWLIGIAGIATVVLTFLKNKELDKVIFGKAEKTEKKEVSKKSSK